MVTTTELKKTESFDIGQILECGQCFRFTKIEDSHYKIIAHDRVMMIKQTADKVSFSCTNDEFQSIWSDYFDLNRDYDAIKSLIAANDRIMQVAIKHAPGIRILKQDFWEMVISFIISQNNRIPMIKKVIENICERYGDEIEGGFSFPSVEQMSGASVESLMELKTGFRAKYIIDAIQKRNDGHLDEKIISGMTTDEIKDRLTTVKGIGDKVAHCIMMMGLGRMDVFPTDVWIKRIISELYFSGADVPLKEIQSFARDKWGDNAGIAQQYLFHYARLEKIGTTPQRKS